MSGLRILISGAGIAGPVLAFFLSRAGATISIVERAPDLRSGGQNVDVRGAGLEVVRRMGLEAAVRDRTTNEDGVAFVDAKDRRAAEFPADPSGQALSLTAEIEIMRGDLAKIFYEATREDVEYLFHDSIQAMIQHEDKVTIEFKNREKRDFDLVIAADGLGSSTRELLLGDSEKSPISSLAQYVSWFTIPRAETDGTWARWYNAPGRRMIFVRPDTGGAASQLTRASMWICSTSQRLKDYSRLGVQEQKTLMHDLFDDAGWEASRILAGMDAADDFYMQEVAQVKMDSAWSRGRVALLGDAAYCPSPISGMGTTVAIVGAYILAGEIARSAKDSRAAFESYEHIMRPFVAKAQKLAPGTPWLANPETSWGISMFNGFLGFVTWSGIAAVMGKFAGPPVHGINLPQYDFKR